MNTWIYYIILLLLNFRSVTNISEKNTLKIDAGKAFYEKKYGLAIDKYQKLETISLTLEPEARLNLAHAYYIINDTTKALNEYEKLLRSTSPTIISTILSQIGVMKTQQGDSLQALTLFKEALQKEPNNDIARYNFELIRKQLPPEPPNNKNTPNNNENENQNSLSGDTEHSDIKQEDLASTSPQKMSKEKALQILEAMKSSELQYMQQKKVSSNKKNQTEKDW